MDGRTILGVLQDSGLADPRLGYDEVIAELARGHSPMLVLGGPDRRPTGMMIISGEQRELIAQLVSIARAPWVRRPPPPAPAIAWDRIAGDLHRTTGRTLSLNFRWEAFSDHGIWIADIAIGGAARGGIGIWWNPTDPEGSLAGLADKLCENWLHEEIWGGWPMCPNHPDRPMWARVDGAGVASWRCEADPADQFDIGSLPSAEETLA